jgi:hypothetical protein
MIWALFGFTLVRLIAGLILGNGNTSAETTTVLGYKGKDFDS